jgi:hypothetical protein
MKGSDSNSDCYSENFRDFDTDELDSEFETDDYNSQKNIGDIEPFFPLKIFPFKQPLKYKRVRKQYGFFDYMKDKKKSSIKKENHRMKLIRGHNRAIRHAFSSNIPKRTINKMSGSNNFQYNSWKIFKSYLFDHEKHFQTISKTKFMPKTDGVTKKTNDEKDMAYKSYNSNFCFEYFSDIRTFISFQNYCKFIFHGFSLEELCQRFTYRCCEGKRHNVNCSVSWKKLENFSTKEMFLELGINL